MNLSIVASDKNGKSIDGPLNIHRLTWLEHLLYNHTYRTLRGLILVRGVDLKMDCSNP